MLQCGYVDKGRSMRITTIGRQLALHPQINHENLVRLRTLPGNKKWRGNILLVDCSLESVNSIRGMFPDANWHESTEGLVSIVEKLESSRLVRPRTNVEDYKFKTVPYDHQKRLLEISRDLPAFAVFAEQGTGKSKPTLDNAVYLWSKGKIQGLLLVVFPNGGHVNWIKNEAPIHIPDWCQWTGAIWESNKGEKKVEHLFKDDESFPLRILAINVEALSTKRGEEICKRFLMAYPSMLVIDESSSIKTPGTQRTKACLRLALYAPYRRILTGTPGGPLHLYSQFSFLDENILGYTSFYAFRARYAVMRPIPGKFARGRKVEIVVGYQHTEELQEKIKPFSFRVLKKDCLDLPEKIYRRVITSITHEQKRIYDEFVEEFCTEFQGRRVTAELAITRMLRCHQVVCGFMPPENKDDLGAPIEGGNPRLDDLMSDIETCVGWDSEAKQFVDDNKIIIWATYRYNIKQIVEALSNKYGSQSVAGYSGLTPEKLRPGIRERFQDTNSSLRFLVANKALAYVYTLNAARYNIYYSNNFDLEVRLQSEDRTHRIGQDKNVIYTDLECPGTIDTTIINRLRRNFELSSSIMGDELREWLTGRETG